MRRWDLNMKKSKSPIVYIGYYKDNIQPVAISPIQELIREYMEAHRSVNPRDYRIERLISTIEEMTLEHPYAIIEEYEDWYIPSIDAEMIEVHKEKVEDLFEDTIHNLKLIYLYTDGIKKIEKERGKILPVMSMLNNFKDSKKVWTKIKDNYKLSELLYMDFETYWKTRTIYIEMKETRQRWDFMIPSKGGDKEEELIDVVNSSL